MKNNKGFSLVELIIVIAIMAILVGVMAPQLIKYIEKTNVSSDTQLADTVKSAVTTAIMDPAVITSSGYSFKNTSAKLDSLNLGGSFQDSVAETLGVDKSNLSSVKSKLKSKGASDITVIIAGSNAVHVKIDGSHADAKSGSEIYVD